MSGWVVLEYLGFESVRIGLLCELIANSSGKMPQNLEMDLLLAALLINGWPVQVRGPTFYNGFSFHGEVGMLVLSRRNGGSLRIGSNVTVTILDSRRNQVRLGIDAPDDVRILRDELIVDPEEELPSAGAKHEIGPSSDPLPPIGVA